VPIRSSVFRVPASVKVLNHVDLNDLNKDLDRVSDAQSLAPFLEQLRKDPLTGEVGSAEQLIERMQAFLVDHTSAGGGYLQRYDNVPGKAWRLVGDLVFSSFIYE
jgi:hypothetical protein